MRGRSIAVSLVSGGDLLVGTIETQGRSSGDISLTAGQTLSLLGPISTEAREGSGAVTLTGQSIELRQTQVMTAGRRGGAVTVTGNLLLDGSRIMTNTLTGGTIEIAAPDLVVTNGGIYQRSGGPAGDLRIVADRVSLDQGAIEVSGAGGDGANLRLTARSLTMTGGSSLLASAGYAGGIGSAQILGTGFGGNVFLDLETLTATANGNNDLISRATNPGADRGQTLVRSDALLRDFQGRSDASLVADFGNSDGLNFRRLASNDVRGIPPKPPVGGPVDPPVVDPPVIAPPVIDPPVIPSAVQPKVSYSDRPITTIAADRGCDPARHWADRTGLEPAPLPNLGAIAIGSAAVVTTDPQTGLVREASTVIINDQGRYVLTPGLGGIQQAARQFRVRCEPLADVLP
jgi:hypothetical protein